MKTTRRSKMLLSSIAMLLVALVALGSATYAWYTVNTVVTANGAQFQASAPEGLVISRSNNSGWTNTIDVNIDGTSTAALAPTSLTFAGDDTDFVASAVKTSATSVDGYAKNSATPVSATANTDYLVDTFYIKSQAKAKTCTVKVAATPATTVAGTFLNYAIIDVTDGSEKVIGVFTSAQGTATHKAINASGTEVDICSDSGNTIANATVAAAKNSGAFVTTATTTISLAADEVHTIKVVAYADGQNENCYTVNGDATKAVTFDLEFSVPAA